MPFRPNPKFPAAMRASPEFVAAQMAAGEAIKEKAQTIAPRGHSHRHYADRFDVMQHHGSVIVTNHDPFAHLVEWGSVNNPPYGVLRRAAHAAGFPLHEAPKR
jgi:hypothetical protein